MDIKHLKKLRNTELEILDFIVNLCETNNLRYTLVGGTLLGAVRHKGFIPWDDDIDIGMPRKDYEKFIKIFPKEHQKFILDSYTTNTRYWLPFIKVRNKNTTYIESVQANYNGNLGIWVDIFPLDNANKMKSLLQRMQFIFTGIIRSSISIKQNIIIGKKKLKETFFIICLLALPKKTLIKLQEKIMMLNHNSGSKYIINLGSQYGYKKQTHLRNKYFPTKKIEFEGKEYNVPNDYNYVLKNIYGQNYMELPPIEKRITHNPIKIKFEDGEEVMFNEKI